MVYFGILYDRMPLISTQVHSSYIYWYTPKKTLGTNIFLFAHVFVFSLFFLLSTISIFTSVFQRVCVCFYFWFGVWFYFLEIMNALLLVEHLLTAGF